MHWRHVKIKVLFCFFILMKCKPNCQSPAFVSDTRHIYLETFLETQRFSSCVAFITFYITSGGGRTSCSWMGWALVSGWWKIALCIRCFVYSFITIIIIIFLSFSVLLNCLYLNPWILLFFSILYFLFLLFFLSHPTGSGDSEWMSMWCLPVCQVKPQQSAASLPLSD